MSLRLGTPPTMSASLLALAAVGAASFGAGSTPASITEPATTGGSTFRVDAPLDFGIDAAYADYQNNDVVRAVCANLFNYPDRPAPASGMRLLPEVAAAMPRISADGLRQTIRIRTTYRFSNGLPVTPRDVSATINRTLAVSAASGTGPMWWMYTIKGARDVVLGRAKAASGIHVNGNSLTFDLVKPDGGLAAKLAGPQFCILPRSTLVNANHPLTSVVSAGPYFVADYVPKQHVVLKVNPHYAGPRPHHVASVVIAFVDESTGIAEVEAGTADLTAWDASYAQARALKRRFGARFTGGAWLNTAFVALNTSRGPFKNPAVRKAVNFASDREALHGRGLDQAPAGLTDQFLPPGMPGYRPVSAYPLRRPDVAKAKAILNAAHARCGNVALWAIGDAPGLERARVLKRDWARIGCRVRIRGFPGSSMFPAIGRKGAPFDAASVGSWTADYLDPGDFITTLFDGSSIRAENNSDWSYLDVPILNRQIHRAERLTGRARNEAFAQLDALIARRYAPYVAIGHGVDYWLFSKRVKSYVLQPAPWIPVPDYAAVSLK